MYKIYKFGTRLQLGMGRAYTNFDLTSFIYWAKTYDSIPLELQLFRKIFPTTNTKPVIP